MTERDSDRADRVPATGPGGLVGPCGGSTEPYTVGPHRLQWPNRTVTDAARAGDADHLAARVLVLPAATVSWAFLRVVAVSRLAATTAFSSSVMPTEKSARNWWL